MTRPLTYIFPAIFETAEDGITITFPDLPGCISCAQDLREAFNRSREVLELFLWGSENDGDHIPEPTPFQGIEAGPGQVVVLVEAIMAPIRDDMAQRAVKATLTLPRWLKAIAEEKSLNLSQILQTALKQELGIYDYNQTKKS